MDSSEHAPAHHTAASTSHGTKNDAMEGVGGDSGGGGDGISSNADLLRKIVEACSRHRSFHEERGHVAVASDDISKNETNMPDRCRKNLSRLTSILPMVEASYTSTSSNAAVDVSHLCGFYNAVVVGAFCPHSLQLFDWGKEARESKNCIHLFTLFFRFIILADVLYMLYYP
jgi:hypothetical protein